MSLCNQITTGVPYYDQPGSSFLIKLVSYSFSLLVLV